MLKKQLIFLPFIFVFGFIWAAWRYHFFYLIIPSFFASATEQNALKKNIATQKKILFYVPRHDLKKSFEMHHVLITWDENALEVTIKQVIEKWLFLQQEAGLIKKHVLCNGVSLHQKTGTLFLSFSHSFLKKKWPLYFSWNLFKSLMNTLLKEFSLIQKVAFLVNYQEWDDSFFDLSQPLSRTLF